MLMRSQCTCYAHKLNASVTQGRVIFFVALMSRRSSSSSSSSSEDEHSNADGDASNTAERYIADLIEFFGAEDTSKKQRVYLMTVSRVLPEVLQCSDLVDITKFSREEVRDMFLDCLDNPTESSRGGRPRVDRADTIVKKMVVAMERHASGEIHFHIAVTLKCCMAFAAAKRTLRERYHVASHWSCSHTQFWSAVAYLHNETPKKPTDPTPLTHPIGLDLYDLSQKPFHAKAWKRSREERDRKAMAGDPKAKMTFNKLDFTALVLDKQLTRKNEVLAFFQDHGNVVMQTWLSKNQRKLKEFMEDAVEWSEARGASRLERLSDWEVLCKKADEPCPKGDQCPYALAACTLFDRNEHVLCKLDLAATVRDVIIHGPSKTTRVPMLVGPTNTGKSTLFKPFDNLFGFSKVFHKPALGSKFPLRNIVKDKRVLFWDDYRPVEYAVDTVPVDNVLTLFQGMPFEVAVSQAFNDGNVDFEWRHGAICTAKEEGLWDAMRHISKEDIAHMKSRFEVFRCTAKVPKLKATDACARCMSRWILDFSNAYDARQALSSPSPVAANQDAHDDSAAGIEGFETLCSQAKVPKHIASQLESELCSLGAVDVRELSVTDWQGLASFCALKPLEARRLLSSLSFPTTQSSHF